jgi:transcriptional regulator with XRE-family HTH domain
MDVSAAFRTQALTLIHAPRAIQTLRAENLPPPPPQSEREEDEAAAQDAWVFTPETGDLLRAMRLRRGLTQEQIADHLGVRRFSVSRWETGDLIPSQEHLNDLMGMLGALPDEQRALSQGILLPPRVTLETEKAFQTIKEHYNHVTRGEYDPRLEPLKDLEYLRLERAFADLIPHYPEARPLLLYTYGFHSQWLVARGRYKEAALYADRVIEAAHQEELPSEWQRAIMTAAHCAVYSSGQPRPSRGIEMLLDWQPQVKDPVFEAWLLSDIAKYQAQDGRLRPALDTIARSCRVALRCENHIELRLRRVDRAELLMQTGQPNDAQLALDLLPPDVSPNPPQRLREELCWSKGLLQVGEVSEAQRRLDRAASEVRTYNLDGARVAELARHF